MGAFHAYDIRGRWGVDFDRDTVYKVGFFLPELLGCREVAVGRDMRLSSPVIHEALQSQGRQRSESLAGECPASRL